MSVDEPRNQTRSDASAEPEARRPYWLIGLVLLGLVVAMLVAAFLLDRQLRPSVGIEPPPATTTAARATVAPTVERSPTLPPAVAPTAAVAAAAPTATTVPPGLRVANSPLEREIEEAYLHYWDVRTQAYFDLDTSHLAEVVAGPKLAREEEQIRQLQAQGKAAKLNVDHRIAFVEVSPDRAVIYDDYLNRSVFVDPATKQELPTNEPPETEKISFEMKKTNGTWKVVDGARHE